MSNQPGIPAQPGQAPFGAPVAPPLGAVTPDPDRAARWWIAGILLGILAFVIVASFIWAVRQKNVMTIWLSAVLPIVSGLVGSAVTFYYGQNQNKRLCPAV